jgi:hypothetical protein
MNGLRSLGVVVICAAIATATATAQSAAPAPQSFNSPRVPGSMRSEPESRHPQTDRPEEVVFQTLDSDGDHEVSPTELAAAPQTLRSLDSNADGKLTHDEMTPAAPPRDRPTWNPRRDSSNERPVQTGFVFINGVYLPPPYVVTMVDSAVLVNNQVLYQPSVEQFEGRSRPPRGFGGSGREIASKLRQDNVVVAFTEQPVVILEGLSELIPSQEQRDTWSQWPDTFEPSTELAARLKEKVDLVKAIITDAQQKSSGSRRLQAMSYPLSILGMVLAVLAIGHVLTFRPTIDITETNHAQVIRATLQSVALIVGLSGLDLAWTLLASQAGIMQELNPLGAKLIEKPLFLIAFKAAATVIAAGLLSALRNYRRAQLASWWLCLVCALVTCRWLVFNSMFVS